MHQRVDGTNVSIRVATENDHSHSYYSENPEEWQDLCAGIRRVLVGDDKEHLDGCRKMIYDRKSSPCTCRAEWNRLVAELNALRETAVNQHEAAHRMTAVIGEKKPEF